MTIRTEARQAFHALYVRVLDFCDVGPMVIYLDESGSSWPANNPNALPSNWDRRWLSAQRSGRFAICLFSFNRYQLELRVP